MADGFDPAIADQLSQLTLVGAQRSNQLNGAIGRNTLANAGSVLTLGVQQTNMGALKNQTKIDPLQAAAAANLRSSQDPAHFGGLTVAAGVPRSGAVPRTPATPPATR